MSARRVFWLSVTLTVVVAGATVLAYLHNQRSQVPPVDDPAGVVWRYLEALERGDYAQAVTYWDPDRWPDRAALMQQLRSLRFFDEDYSVSLGATHWADVNHATVTLYLVEIVQPPTLFAPTGSTYVLEAHLHRQNHQWFLITLPPPLGPWLQPEFHNGPLPPPPLNFKGVGDAYPA